MTKKQQSEKAEYIDKLRATLKPGDTLYTVLRSVSRTGMSRVVDVYHLTPEPDGTIRKSWLSYWIAKACEFQFQDQCGKPEGIKIGGCGMDVGFEVVYNLGRALWPDGFPCAGRKCRSNDHTNGDRNRRANHMHRDGGYAFKHEWI